MKEKIFILSQDKKFHSDISNWLVRHLPNENPTSLYTYYEFIRTIESFPTLILLTDLTYDNKDHLYNPYLVINTLDKYPNLKVIVFDDSFNDQSGIYYHYCGILGYFRKKGNFNGLKDLLESLSLLLAIERLQSTVSKRSVAIDPKLLQQYVVLENTEIEKIYLTAIKIALTDEPVLIYGETGTGKEHLAETIHRTSKRSNNNIISINCSAIPSSLLESTLFGHKKGAFTGALDNNIGYFQNANNGTLFLDEIGDLDIRSQIKLLRTLESGEIQVLGENNSKKVDVRIIAATNKVLEKEIQNGNFRDDLFYRLNSFKLYLPPLRNREKREITALINHFINDFNKRYNRSILGFDNDALTLLLNYRFPGNIRELKKIVYSCSALCENNLIHEDSLPNEVKNNK